MWWFEKTATCFLCPSLTATTCLMSFLYPTRREIPWCVRRQQGVHLQGALAPWANGGMGTIGDTRSVSGLHEGSQSMIGDGGKDRVRAYNCQAKKGREFKIGIGTKTVFFCAASTFSFSYDARLALPFDKLGFASILQNSKKSVFSFCIMLGLHYLCSQKKNNEKSYRCRTGTTA